MLLNGRKTENFCNKWKFSRGDFEAAESVSFDDSLWENVTLPHDWSIYGPFSQDNPTTARGGFLPAGIGWYRKAFALPEHYRDKHIVIEFGGVFRRTAVWVNGVKAGFWANGYVTKRFDISSMLKAGTQNVIAVRVDALWYIIILGDWYKYNGRANLVLSLSAYWRGLLNQLLGLVHKEGEALREEEFLRGFFLDWSTKNQPESAAGIYALFVLCLRSAISLCRIAGFADLENECNSAIKILCRKPHSCGDKKQVTALAYLSGQLDSKTAGKILLNGGARGLSTFMSGYILEAATRTGGISAALDILKEYYGAMLNAGATTFWEDFDIEWVRENARIDRLPENGEYDIHGDNGRYCYKGFRHSLCHGWSSAPAAFLAENVLGIHIAEAGCRIIEIKPQLGSLKWAKGTYPTPLGVISVFAERLPDGTVKTDIAAPNTIKIIK